MKKNSYRIITIITYILISFLAISMTINYVLKKEQELLEKRYLSLSENLQDKINSLVQKKKNATLALTITLANNTDIKQILQKKDFKNDKLTKLSLLLRKETDFKNVWFQVLDEKGVSLFRSWSEKKGDDLSKLRPDVKSMIYLPKIKSTISVGKYDITFKAMVPIFEDNKFIGVIESITHFNSISRGLRVSDNVEPIIVTEEKFTKQLVYPFTNLFVDNHYIANISADKYFLDYLKKLGTKEIISNKNYLVDNDYLILKSFLSFNSEKLATFVMFKKLDAIDVSSIEEYKTNAFLYLGLFIALLGLILYIISYYLYSKEITKLYIKLNENQKELKELNETLKITVDEEVAKNNKKNRLIFHQSKLAAMGEMIENIAHQWRQPLSIISTAASGIKLKKEMGIEVKPEEEVEILDSIVNTSKYLSNTIDDFRYFFSKDKKKTLFNIDNLIDKAVNLVQTDFDLKNILIVKDIESIELKSYENELLQVLLNFFNNSKDEFLRQEVDNRIVFINAYKKVDEIFIEVIDNAGGINESIIDRVFEPYFTTKHKTQGTGIGLYMSEEIISKHMQGSIDVYNKEFNHNGVDMTGAKFIIRLPIEIEDEKE